MTDVIDSTAQMTVPQLADLIKAHRLLHQADPLRDYHCACGEWKAGAFDPTDRNAVLHSWELHVAEVLAGEGTAVVPESDYAAEVAKVAQLRNLLDTAQVLIDAKSDHQMAVEAELEATRRLVELRTASAEANITETYAEDAHEAAMRSTRS